MEFVASEISWQSTRLRDIYTANNGDAAKMLRILTASGSLQFPAFSSGLFPASSLSSDLAEATGMGDAWVRDSAQIAAALAYCGRTSEAVRAAQAILTVFSQSTSLMEKIIQNSSLSENVMNRPPARVNGETLTSEKEWANAQNDSVGNALWLIAGLVETEDFDLKEEDWATLDLMVNYLSAIEYWRDADNGCWEEARKVNASSVGAVLAGLKKYLAICRRAGRTDFLKQIEMMIENGKESLSEILPDESREPADLVRSVDAALVFLVEPLQIVNPVQARQIVERITEKLLRPNGIARYEGDSYWAPEYRAVYDLGERTANFSERMDERDALIVKGSEAQWTLFDPLLAIYWLKEFRQTGDNEDLARSRWHYARSLAQFVDTADGWAIPEAFFFENGEWVSNDHVPLLWSQANVLRMLNDFSQS